MSDPAKDELTRALTRSLGAPMEELGQFIADKIRFLRWKTAIRTLEKAKNILDKKEIKANKPSLKFLVPFLEECSLEEEAELEDAWANILASASEEERPEHTVYIGILSRLKSAHLKYLDFLCGYGVPLPLRRDISLSVIPVEFSPWSVRKFVEIESSPRKFIDVDYFINVLEDFFNAPGVGLSFAYLEGKYGEVLGVTREIEWPRSGHLDHNLSTILALQALGIIMIRDLYGLSAGLFSIDTRYEHITEFGVDFYKCCRGGAV